jgi:hypothetical protein
MQDLPAQLVASFERKLDQDRVPQSRHPDYHKWVRFFLYFCQKFDYPPTAPTALGPFLTKLAAKGHSIDQRHQAAAAVGLLIQKIPAYAPRLPLVKSEPAQQVGFREVQNP